MVSPSQKNQPVVEPERNSVRYKKDLTPWFPAREVKSIMRAYKISKYGHRDQFRDGGVIRYFEHPKAVSLIPLKELEIYDAQVAIMALLHDVFEDSYLLDEELMEIIFGRGVANGVRILSKNEENKPVYYPRLKVCGVWRVLLVKVCDRVHNMRTLGDNKAKQQKQTKETRLHFFELCDILEKLIPKKYRGCVPYLRKELETLCSKYE